jgi:23S rRNA pseudouridine1911/1915/1917 synthase
VTAVVPAVLAGERIDRVVALLTSLPRSEVAALVAGGQVRVDGRPVTSKSRRVAEGEEVSVEVPEAGPVGVVADPSVEVPVLHADDDVVVVDKPPGLVVHPGAGNVDGTLVQGLLARFPDLATVGDDLSRPGVVHRLDAGTSGLLVVARSDAAYRSLVAQLQARSVERLYLALVKGHVEAPVGVVDAPIGRSSRDPTLMAVVAEGREARTRYEVEQRFDAPAPCTLVVCRLETGRTHQIRVHMAAIGHPVVGDPRYGAGRRDGLRTPRLFLHAYRLAFDHPATGERVSWTSPLPPDLEAVRAGLS